MFGNRPASAFLGRAHGPEKRKVKQYPAIIEEDGKVRTNAFGEWLQQQRNLRRLTREEFDEIVDLVSAGIETGRGRRMAYLHRDRVNGRLRGRRGARLATLTRTAEDAWLGKQAAA